MCPRATPQESPSAPCIILVADLSGYAKSFEKRSDSEMAHFLDRYYASAEGIISSSGGKVIKFMGDSVLAIFPAEMATEAVVAAVSLEAVVERSSSEENLRFSLGANLHFGPAVQCEL